MRIAIVGGVCALAACGARYRYEPAGRAPAVIGDPAPGAGVPVRAGVRNDVVIRVSAPRAEVVAWELVCPGAREEGTAGETMDAYRSRRLAELRRDRDRERDTAAAIGGAIGGAVLGRVSATAATPAGGASVQVNGAAVGAAAGAATVSDDVQLAPGDVGGGTYTARATVTPDGDGACTVAIAPDDGGDPAGLAGDFDVTRVIDRDREARVQAAVVVGRARDVRASVQVALVADGADPELRARVRATAEARVEAEAHARAQIVAEVNGRAWAAREGMVAWLSSCGGDPDRRAREREALARRQDEQARREQLARDAERARVEQAIAARDAQIALLVSDGAVARPPMPPAPDESPGAAPAGQVWIAGHWEWDAPRWIWIGGGWSASEVAGAAVEASTSAVATEPSAPIVVITPAPPPPPARTADHRTESRPAPSRASTAAPRDHRDDPRDHRR